MQEFSIQTTNDISVMQEVGKSELQICESCVAIIPLRSSPMTVETFELRFCNCSVEEHKELPTASTAFVLQNQ